MRTTLALAGQDTRTDGRTMGSADRKGASMSIRTQRP